MIVDNELTSDAFDRLPHRCMAEVKEDLVAKSLTIHPVETLVERLMICLTHLWS